MLAQGRKDVIQRDVGTCFKEVGCTHVFPAEEIFRIEDIIPSPLVTDIGHQIGASG